MVVAAAERTSDDTVNFMATHARGLIGLALTNERVERLGLNQPEPAEDLGREAYTVSIEARDGVSTGISASDRARTIQVAMAAWTKPEDIVTPGHVFPAIGVEGGVLKRRGWAEAGLDIARLAGIQPATAFCHILDDAGELAPFEELVALAGKHGLCWLTMDDLVAHRLQRESFVAQLTQSTLPTRQGDFLVRAFHNTLDGGQHLALSMGDIRSPEPVLVRIHSECLTGDVFGSRRCDCGPQLTESLRRIAEEGRGVVIYLRQEGRGIGLTDKLRAYALQDSGRDTVEANIELGHPAEARTYAVGAQMLLALGVPEVRLLTNNPGKVDGLKASGVTVVAREPLEIAPTKDNAAYLATKKTKMGHLLSQV